MNEILALGNILQTVVIVGIIWLLKGVSRINGSIRVLDEWRKLHTEKADERHEGLKEQIAGIWRKIGG